VVLDQFSRCIHRGTSSAFKYDHIVVGLVREFESKGFMKPFSCIQRFFLGVAIQHSESIDDQEYGLGLAKAFTADASEEIQAYFEKMKGFPLEHYEVVKRFNRFPSRNAALVSCFLFLSSYFLSVLLTLNKCNYPGTGQHRGRTGMDGISGVSCMG
jgi:uncharacterized protein (DUF924 family)